MSRRAPVSGSTTTVIYEKHRARRTAPGPFK